MNSKSVKSILKIALNPARSSIVNSLMMLLKYPLSLLLFTPFPCFPTVRVFAIGIHQLMQHYKCGYLSHFELLNQWTFGLFNFRMLDKSVQMRISGNMGCGFHPTFSIKFWMKCRCICVGLIILLQNIKLKSLLLNKLFSNFKLQRHRRMLLFLFKIKNSNKWQDCWH